MALKEILENLNTKIVLPINKVFPFDYNEIIEMEENYDGTVVEALETYLDAEANEAYDNGIDMPIPMEIAIKGDKLILNDWTYADDGEKMDIKDVVKKIVKLGISCENGYIEIV